MNLEHLLYVCFSCLAVVCASWSIHLFMSGPKTLQPLPFHEYSTIDDPLYRPPDKLHIDPLEVDDELTTGSISKTENPTKATRTNVSSSYNVVSVYDQMAVVKNKSGKIWTLVLGSELPELGIVLSIDATAEHWIVTGTHGVLATMRATNKNN